MLPVCIEKLYMKGMYFNLSGNRFQRVSLLCANAKKKIIASVANLLVHGAHMLLYVVGKLN